MPLKCAAGPVRLQLCQIELQGGRRGVGGKLEVGMHRGEEAARPCNLAEKLQELRALPRCEPVGEFRFVGRRDFEDSIHESLALASDVELTPAPVAWADPSFEQAFGFEHVDQRDDPGSWQVQRTRELDLRAALRHGHVP